MEFSLTGYARNAALAAALTLSGGCQNPQRPRWESELGYTLVPQPHHCPFPSREKATELTIHMIRAFEGNTLNPAIFRDYRDMYRRVAVEAADRRFNARDLNCRDITIHYYIVEDPHLREEDRILLRSLVLGQKTLLEVMGHIAAQEQNPPEFSESRDRIEFETRFQSMHWALSRYADPEEYQQALRTTYLNIVNQEIRLSTDVCAYFSRMSPRALKNFYEVLDSLFDDLFSGDNPRYREFSRLVPLIERTDPNLTLPEWQAIFLRVKYFVAAMLRVYGDDFTPLGVRDISISHTTYWANFTEHVASFMGNVNIALLTPDPFDDSQLIAGLATYALDFRSHYARLTPSQRVASPVIHTDQWFDRAFSLFGAQARGQYQQYRPAFAEPSVAASLDTRVWTEPQILRNVRRQNTIRMSPSQLPSDWRRLAEQVYLEVPFEDRPTFRGTALEFIQKYTNAIYFTNMAGQENEAGTILPSEKAVVLRVGSTTTLSSLRVLEALVHETYHLAFHEEIVSRHPELGGDLLLNEHNAYALGLQFDERVFPLILEASLRGNAANTEPSTENREQIRLNLASISFSLATAFLLNTPSFEPTLEGTTDPFAIAAQLYLNDKQRIEDANTRIGYSQGDYSIRYDISPQLPISWRHRYPTSNPSSDYMAYFRQSLIHLFGIAGFDMLSHP